MTVEERIAFDPEKWDEQRRRWDEISRKRAAQVHPANQHVLDIIMEANDPIKITTVANQFARETGHSWKSRAEREDFKKKAFRIVGELIKGFFLERHRRKWVRWVPPDNARRRAFEQHVDEVVKSLPKPNI